MVLRHDPTPLRPAYESAEPFPHIVLDDLFPDETLETILAHFPDGGTLDWVRFENAQEKKLGYHHRDEWRLPPPIREFLHWMNSPAMLQFLEQLTGIAGLVPDPYFGGGGLHQILPGGFLKVHADFNWHPILRLDRRLNALVYLNKDWEDEWGGHLELWDREMKGPVQRIAPHFNRTVVFSTTDFSYHGHPSPLACPEGRSRKSVSLYYYTNGRPEEERSAPHDTLFQKRFETEW
ncbi:MAG: 2OG-Fe(II) oxygenase [Thermoanaerobaculia bacterium]